MLNLFTNFKSWMIASLVVATAVFGKECAPVCPPKPCPKPCPQPCPPTQVCPPVDPCCPAWPTPVLNAAYNYPARIQTRCPWDIFCDVSFIYWQATEDNLELGISNSTNANLAQGINGRFINMDFDFKPGFKVGIGGNFAHDNWDTRFEYTWFHNTNSKSSDADSGGNILATVGSPLVVSHGGVYQSGNQHLNLKMDIIDWTMGRWYYVGTKLVFHPTFGIRADWIRQNLSTEYTRTGTAFTSISADTANVHQKTRSWGLGPEVGLDANWNVGWGFRFFGNAEADLLFTDYTKLSFSETHTIAPGSPVSTSQGRVYTVKPHFDLELGLGWGTYLDCNNWYMDFAVGYDFQVFFDQNMFRHFNDDVMVANSLLPNGNLYLQGLTATFRLDF